MAWYVMVLRGSEPWSAVDVFSSERYAQEDADERIKRSGTHAVSIVDASNIREAKQIVSGRTGILRS